MGWVVRAGEAKAADLVKGNREQLSVPCLYGFSVHYHAALPWQELAKAGRFANAQVSIADFRALLARYAGPVLVLNGQYDRVDRKRERRMLDAAQRARLAIVPAVGHLCNLDEPEAFTASVRDFAASGE